MADRKGDKRYLGEAAAGTAIAGYAPNAIYHAESQMMNHRLKNIDHQIAHHDEKRPVKPQPTKGPFGNMIGVPAEQKKEFAQKVKAHSQAREALNVARKTVKPKLYPKQTALWLGSAAVGIPLAAHGLHRSFTNKHEGKAFSKKDNREFTSRDADAAVIGAAGTYGVYQGGAIVGSKPYENRKRRQIQKDPRLREIFNEHKKQALGGQRSKIETGDKSLRGKMYHNYPKELPGARFKRVVSYTHAGPSGVAATAALAGLGAYGAVKLDRKMRDKQQVHKRQMSDAEIRHRKKIQGHLSLATGTLGLAALGGTLAAGKKINPKIVSGLKRIGVPHAEEHFSSPNIKSKVEPVLAASAGAGGAGSFNFASYTNAESKKRKQRVMTAPVVKNAPSPFEDGYYGEVGFSKYYDPENDRMKRLNHYEDASLAAAGAGTALATHQGVKAAQSASKIKSYHATEVNRGGRNGNLWVRAAGAPHKAWSVDGPNRANFKALKGHGKKAAVAAAVGAAGVYANKKIREKKTTSWSPYVNKSATSAFGVLHD